MKHHENRSHPVTKILLPVIDCLQCGKCKSQYPSLKKIYTVAKISIYVPDRTLWVTFTTENGLILHVVLRYKVYYALYTENIYRNAVISEW